MVSNLSQEQWDEKVIELSGSILQSWIWGEFQESLGYKVYRLSSDDYVNQIIEIPLLTGKKYWYSPRGPLGNAKQALAELANLSKKDHSIVFARLEPAIKLDLPQALKETQPSHDWMLDLTQTLDQISMGMKPKTRYNINLSQRKGVTVREGTKEDLLTVYKLFLETAGRNNYRLHPQAYYLQMWETLHPNCLKILVAEYQGKPLACMFLSLFGKTATYLHGGSSQTMKEAMAPYILHFEAMKLAKNAGCEYYNFGGVATDNSPNHAWSGISRFKRGFGGFEVSYPGSFELIFSPLWYNVYKNARKLRNIIRTK